MGLTVITLCALLLAGCSEKPAKEEASKKKSVATPGSVPGEIVTETELDITIPVVLVWQASTVDSVGDVGHYNSLSYGPEGQLAIAYYDATKGDLKCAVSTVDGERIFWKVDVVDSLGDVGISPSLSHDPDGKLAISYYDTTNRTLKYALYDGEKWTTSTVDSEDNVGRYSSLSHGPDGRPAISYYDRSNADLKYAAYNGTRWVRSVVDSTGKVGQYNCLSHGPEGYPVISYYDQGEGALKCALYFEDEWRVVTVDDGSIPGTQDNEADVGKKGSLIHGVDGKPAISYFDDTNGNLKYAVYEATLENFKYDGGEGLVGINWHVETIDGIENIGQVSSLSQGANGQPAISCREYKEEHLLYLTRSAENWVVEILYPAGLVEEITSLGYAPNGRPAISCYDVSRQELKLVSFTIVPKEEVEQN
ncbi:MAG: hypothetical protein VCA55_15465 [Verrucomicrobiales bacterium]